METVGNYKLENAALTHQNSQLGREIVELADDIKAHNLHERQQSERISEVIDAN